MRRSIVTALPALWAFGLFALPQPSLGQEPSQVVAGIEVGSKSVKGVVLKIPPLPAAEALKAEFTTTVQTNLTANIVPAQDGKGSRFDKDAITRTVLAVKKACDEIVAKYPNVKEFVLVASSGAADAVDQVGFNELKEKIKEAKIPRLPELTNLSAEDEVRLTFLGVTERKERNSTLSLDIGSGNTKFGFAEQDRAGNWMTKHGAIPFGSNTLAGNPQAPKVDPALRGAEHKAQVDAFSSWADVTLGMSLAPETVKVDDKMRDTIYMTGGIVWAMVSLEQPDLEEKRLVLITPALVKSFVAHARSDDPYSDERPRDPAAEKQATAVKAVFNRQQLLAGAKILEAVCGAFGVTETKPDGGVRRTAYFARDGLLAWISGRVQESQKYSRSDTSVSEDVFLEQMKALRDAVEKKNPPELSDLIRAIDKGVKELQNQPPAPQPAPDPGQDLSPITDSIKALQDEVKRLREELKESPPSETSSTPKRRDSALAWGNFHRGMELYQGGWFQDARAHFEAAIKADGEPPAFWYALALAQYSIGSTDEARATASKLADLEANYPDQGLRYYRLFERIQGDDRRAVEGFLREAEDKPLQPRIRLSRF